jgi:hypothetical protein
VNEAILDYESEEGQNGPAGRLVVFSLIPSSEGGVTEFIEFFRPLFRPAGAMKQFTRPTKPFSVFGADVRKQPMVIRFQRDGRHCRPRTTGDSQMRTTSFILAFAFILAGPSMAGSSDQNLPGVGTFAYHGSPVATAASQPMIVAAK